MVQMSFIMCYIFNNEIVFKFMFLKWLVFGFDLIYIIKYLGFDDITHLYKLSPLDIICKIYAFIDNLKIDFELNWIDSLLRFWELLQNKGRSSMERSI